MTSKKLTPLAKKILRDGGRPKLGRSYLDVLKDGLDAEMALFADVRTFDMEPAMKLIYAFEEMADVARRIQDDYLFEHLVHHCGVTRKTPKSKSIDIGILRNCAEAKAVRGPRRTTRSKSQSEGRE